MGFQSLRGGCSNSTHEPKAQLRQFSSRCDRRTSDNPARSSDVKSLSVAAVRCNGAPAPVVRHHQLANSCRDPAVNLPGDEPACRLSPGAALFPEVAHVLSDRLPRCQVVAGSAKAGSFVESSDPGVVVM